MKSNIDLSNPYILLRAQDSPVRIGIWIYLEIFSWIRDPHRDMRISNQCLNDPKISCERKQTVSIHQTKLRKGASPTQLFLTKGAAPVGKRGAAEPPALGLPLSGLMVPPVLISMAPISSTGPVSGEIPCTATWRLRAAAGLLSCMLIPTAGLPLFFPAVLWPAIQGSIFWPEDWTPYLYSSGLEITVLH